MPLQRKEHWDQQGQPFDIFLVTNINTPFKWGTRDCALFAADAVEAITGTDIASEFRGKYKTELGALKAIKSITGGTTVEDAVAHCAAKHGLQEYQFPLQAKRGDLVIVDNCGNLIAAITHLNGRHVVSVSETGLVRLPITSVRRAWAI